MVERPPIADDSPLASAPSVPTVARAMSWVGAGHVVGQAFWFGSLIVLAALLQPRAFGTVTIGLLMVTAGTRLMEAGTRGAIIVAPGLRREQVRTALISNVVAGGLISALIVVLAGPMVHAFARGSSVTVLRALGLSVVLYAPAVVPLALLEKRFAFRRRAAVQTGATITASTASVAAGLLGAGVWSLVLRQVLFQLLLALLGWLAARRLVPQREAVPAGRRWDRLEGFGASAFMLFSLTDFVVFNADYLTVGHVAGPTQLGLYSLAFTIAFAPVTQFAAQIGSVLFPAAATSDAETLLRRTLAGVRITCLVLLPAVPIAIVLAPTLIPAILGERWSGMVPPFQILLVVGVAHAVVNVIGESLSGTGRIGFRARVNSFWMVAMIPALVVLVRLDGVRGAALAHLLLYIPVALAYAVWGMRLLGSGPAQLARALRGVAVPFALEALATALVLVAASAASGGLAAPVAAACAGTLVGGVALVRRGNGALGEARAFLSAGRRGAAR
jgi:O-antigen/teichoic acid export membrane protein